MRILLLVVVIMKRYLNKLEETDSPLGYLEIEVSLYSATSLQSIYKLSVDGVDLPCSKSIKRDIYNFLERKIMRLNQLLKIIL